MKFIILLSVFLSSSVQAGKQCQKVAQVKDCRSDSGLCKVILDDKFEVTALDPLVGSKVCRYSDYPYWIVEEN